MQRPESKVDACRLAAPIAIYSSQHEFSSKAPCCSSTQNLISAKWTGTPTELPHGIAVAHLEKKIPAISLCFEMPLLATTLFLYGQNYVPNPQPWTAIFSQSLQGFNLRHLTFLTLAKNRVAPNPASLLFFHCTFGASHFWNLTLVSCEWTIMHQGICQKTTTTVQILRRHHYLGTLTVYSTVTDS